MIYSNLSDLHTHSNHSFDGHNSCFELCKSAIENNIKMLAITDHSDMDSKNYDFETFVRNQFEDLTQCENMFSKDLTLIKGIEIGQGIYLKEKTEKLYNNTNYDFFLGSIHNLENIEDFYFLKYNDSNIKDYLEQYFNNIINLIKWGYFDSLAHLTYPLRYIVYRDKINVNIHEYDEQIKTILEELIINKKSLEFNFSGLHTFEKYTLPDKEILKIYKSMGGKYITVGSDSHYAKKIGLYADNAYDIIQECGFDEVTIYQNHEPKNIKIV